MKTIICCILFTWALIAQALPSIAEEQAVVCAACHGVNGVSTNPIWPNLAGQHASYLAKQLLDMKEGRRDAPTMAAMVSALSPQEIEALAAYYAKMPLPEGATAKHYVARGEALYRGGDFKTHVTACIACHGPQGLGNAQAGFPVLSGQQALYTLQQLVAFKDKTRHNDLNGIMQSIGARMSQADMEAVANYVAGLH